MRHLLPILFSCCTVAASTAAHAGVVAFSSASAFAAATTGVTDYPFPAPGNGTEFEAVASPYALGPLPFSGASLSLFNDAYYGSSQTYLGLDGSKSYTVSADGVSAIAVDLGSFLYSQTLTVMVNGTSLEKLVIPEAQQPLFLGITSSAPIDTIFFVPGIAKSEVDVLDADVGSTVATTPEPPSLLLLATGSLGFAGALRRSRHRV